MTYNEIIRRLNNIRRRLSMNSKDDIENEKALESAIEMVKGVTSGAIVPIEWHENIDEMPKAQHILICFKWDIDDYEVAEIDPVFLKNTQKQCIIAWAYKPKPFKKNIVKQS